ncbi:ABC transporter substrate-binding protein [Actinacidiphila oryziradicis]|jgi:peptide/nickel transport system substrate-binding protein|uniref:ABC transporter substrate-binding protein n=1 Tax=Actinacidiphila oryziradicis TaxID=2571141 RepID=UPI0023F4EF55|nr:ABC transporter substrate-binding protein [Actinacidiphila oryziradicis]MCW2870558.1 peptide transporter binding protein [Actinacidiphila oryziradicis]
MSDTSHRRHPGGIPRRSLLAATAAGGGALGASWLLTGCSGTNGGTAANAIPTVALAGKPSSGGTLKIARPPASDAENLDSASSLSAYEYLGALYNRLVRVGSDGNLAADLAESWEPDAKAITWTFHLRRGVTFHDGRAFTSADAAYTLRHILDAKTASPQAAVLAPLVDPKTLRTPDAHTLVVPLKTPNAEFPSLLTHYNCYVIPNGSGTSIGRTGIGTGPFKLVSFTPAGAGRVTAYADHWQGRPVLDAIDFYSVADTQARSNALLAGQVHLISQTNLDFATARVVAASDRATIARVKNAQWYVLPMLTTDKPFNDVRVRQAMKLAYDPEYVLKVALQDAGSAGWDNPVPPSDPYYVAQHPTHDPDKARSLLKQAGHEGLAVDLYTSSYDPILTPMALAYQDSAKRAGINIRVKTASADSYYTQIWMKKPLMTSYWYTGRPVDQLLNQIFRSGSSYNETAWSDKSFDALIDRARRETDDTRRRDLYAEAQQKIMTDGGEITPMFADRLVGISRKVRGYAEHGFEFDYLGIGLKGA